MDLSASAVQAGKLSSHLCSGLLHIADTSRRSLSGKIQDAICLEQSLTPVGPSKCSETVVCGAML